MALFANKGKTSLNPSVITDGLIFYVDPNNKLCTNNSGKEYTDLLKRSSSFTGISAGKLFSAESSLSSFRNNRFINIDTLLKSTYGNISPTNFFNEYTIQFWVKNNSQKTNSKRFFTSNTSLISSTVFLNLTTNLNLENFFAGAYNSLLPVDRYNRSTNNKNGRPYYISSYRFFGQPRTYIYWTGSKWSVTLFLDNEPAEYFYSLENTIYPYEATTWSSGLTSFILSGDDFSNEIFREYIQDITRDLQKESYFPYVLNEYRRNYYVTGHDGHNGIIIKDVDGYFNIMSPPLNFYNIIDPIYKGINIVDKPWMTSYKTTFPHLSALSDIYVDLITFYPLSGAQVPPYPFEHAYFKAYVFNTSMHEIFTYYHDINNPIFTEIPMSQNGWVVGIYISLGSGGYVSMGILSAASTYPINPSLISNWQKCSPNVNGSFVNEGDYRWQSIKFNNSVYKCLTSNNTISAFPKTYTDVTGLLTNEKVLISESNSNEGFILSGNSSRLIFKHRNYDALNVDSNFNTLTSEWSCITLTQSGKNVTLYKNGYYNYFDTGDSKLFGLSGIFITDDVSIGQILIYNRCLSSIEVKQNYDSFKSRYFLGEYKKPNL